MSVVLITGEGPDFCAGMDLTAMAGIGSRGRREFLESAQRSRGIVSGAAAITPSPWSQPCGDARWAEDAGWRWLAMRFWPRNRRQFGYPEVNIGFVPAIVMSMLRRSVGEKRAFDLLASGEPVGAREACDLE